MRFIGNEGASVVADIEEVDVFIFSAAVEESSGDVTISGCVHDMSLYAAGEESNGSDILSGCMHDGTNFAAKEGLIADTVSGLVQDGII